MGQDFLIRLRVVDLLIQLVNQSKAQELLDAKFGGATADIIILMSNNSLKATDPAFKDAATQLLATLKARPEVASVTSYYSTHSASFLSRDSHETFAVVQFAAKDEATKDERLQNNSASHHFACDSNDGWR